MTERFKDFIGRHIFHPLQGMTLGNWWALLRRHRFSIDLQHLPRALVQTSISASNSVNAADRVGVVWEADRGCPG